MWGVLGVSVRMLSEFGFSAIQIVVTRLLVSAAVLGVYLFFTDKSKMRMDLKDVKWFVGTGIFSMLFFNTCYCITVELTSLSVAAVLLYTSPVFVVLISRPVFKEKITAEKWAAVALSVTGCALVSGIQASGVSGIRSSGIASGIGAAVGYALYSVLAKILLKKYDSLTILLFTFAFAGAGGLFITPVREIAVIVGNAPIAAFVIIVSAIICCVAPYVFYNRALSAIQASKASVIASIEPIVATAAGVVAFGEGLTFSGIIGTSLILIAIAILNSR
jgi:drug/metabolite transporter (DMT)-like permease